MYIYRFRIQSQANEDFLLDIEFKSNQTFLDFHNAIKEYCNIVTNELAVFYVCDSQWRKKKEIVLMDMMSLNDEEDVENKKDILLMSEIKISQMIEEPHQKLIYEYDYLNLLTFDIELLKIGEAVVAKKYPLLIQKIGEIKIKQINYEDIDLSIDEEDEQSIKDSYDDEIDVDFDELETGFYFEQGDDL